MKRTAQTFNLTLRHKQVQCSTAELLDACVQVNSYDMFDALNENVAPVEETDEPSAPQSK